MDEQTDFKEYLMRRLDSCGLKEKIVFDETAFKRLEDLSRGDIGSAMVYAGSAVLDSLQNQDYTITGDNIEKVDIGEAIGLMLGGEDVWDNVRRIGKTVPDMTPEGVQLSRMLNLWDANRTRDSMDAPKNRRLPKYALSNMVVYDEKGTLGPEINIPFRYSPSEQEVESVADIFARFVSEHSGQKQTLERSSQRGPFGPEFFVLEDNPEKDRFLRGRNYRVSKQDFFPLEGSQGSVVIYKEMGCRQEDSILENFAKSLNPKQA